MGSYGTVPGGQHAGQSAGTASPVQRLPRRITRSSAGSRVRSPAGVRRILEDDFYDARFRLLTPRECAYVLAMADLGPGPHTTGEIAARFGTTSETMSSIRYQLVKKDVIYSPMSGMAEFRIPLTERYVLRHKTELERRARESRVQRRR
jgi:hypothetical protein